MHTYVISTVERWRIYFFLAAASIFSVKAVDLLVTKYHLTLPSWLHIPSAFAVYGIVYVCFDKWLWRFKPLSILGVIDVPYVAGKWQGSVRSSMEEFSIAYPVVVQIHQTWNKISIHLDGSSRESYSTMAMFELKNPTVSSLEWTFISRNKPGVSKPDMFCGVTRLKLDLEGNTVVCNSIKGDYYTETGRDTYGSIELTRA